MNSFTRPVWIAVSMSLVLVVFAVQGFLPLAGPATITVNPSKTYQTIIGWEATAQAGQLDCPTYPKYKNTMFDLAANDLGINRLRIEVRSGDENPIDYFTQWVNGQISRQQWRAHWYEIVNDNGDPNNINANGFHFSELDNKIDNVVLPLRQRLQARGERLYLNVNYVDFEPSGFEHKTNPQEYGEFVLAVYQHMQSKYGFVPDSWEAILEPDVPGAGWSGTQIGNGLAAAASRLQAAGFTPAFVAPSNTNMANAVTWFDQMVQVPGVEPYISELSYHRYAGVSESALQAIANRSVQYGIGTAMLEHIGSTYQDLHQDIKMGRNTSWQQYALAFCGPDDGTKYYWIDQTNPNNPVVNMGGQTKFLRHYFRYVRAGAVRVDASTSNGAFDPLAFRNKNGGYVVVMNTTSSGTFTINGLPAGTYGIKYTTNSKTDQSQADVTIQSGQAVTGSIPEAGVVTVYSTTPINYKNKMYLPYNRSSLEQHYATPPKLFAPQAGY